MTIEQKAKAYDEAIKRMKSWVRGEHPECFTEAQKAAEFIFPELKESEDERIKQRIIKLIKMSNEVGGFALHKWEADEMLAWLEKQGDCSAKWEKNTADNKPTLNHSVLMKNIHGVAEGEWNGKEWIQYRWSSNIKDSDVLYWMNLCELEKQGDIDKASYEIAEKEKYDFVNGQFIECRKSFNEFKEDNSYWFEYVGNDTYIGRSDNILDKKFHITPRQLYRLFTQQHCPKENNVNEETNAPTAYGKYVDECLNEAAEHFFSEGEDKYSVADLFYAGVRCGQSWLKKQDEKPIIEMKSPEESLGISSKEYNEIVNECLYGESNSPDKVEPKFKVGDWLVQNERRNIIKVVDATPLVYKVVDILGYHHIITDDCIENNYHLWTIQDSKDGDVLVFKQNYPFIYNGHYNTFYVGAHCGVSYEAKKFYIARENGWAILEGVYPATKEQRDALMKAMADVGYTFDFEKKELKEIVIPPIFNIGDVLCDKSRTTLNKNYQPNFEIIDIKNGMYICNNCTFPISQQDEYELVAKRIEPQPAWSADEATYIHEVETGNGNIKALVTEKVKLPKFKVGDWITNGDYTWEVVEIMVLDYVLRSQDGNIVDDTISHTDEQFHLWTIQDAKEGDVLVTKYNQPFIYNGNYDLFNVGAYCGMDCLGEIFIESCTKCQWSSTKVKPATKDQRDALERAMTNAGYRWNKEKLKLERI